MTSMRRARIAFTALGKRSQSPICGSLLRIPSRRQWPPASRRSRLWRQFSLAMTEWHRLLQLSHGNKCAHYFSITSCLMSDHLTPSQRSWNMSRIRGMDTSPEKLVRRCAYCRGLRYRTHVMSLPGRPDMVFASARVVVFLDGAFWHGWRFSRWCARLSPYWHEKIARNRRRDRKNFRALRRAGWRVIRIWEHDVIRGAEACVDRIECALKQSVHGRPVSVPKST